MKPITFITLFFLFISSTFASEKLTTSKAKSILSECIKGKSSGKAYIETGERSFNTEFEKDIKKLALLKSLKDQGFIKLGSINSGKGGKIEKYNIELTEKANPYVIKKGEKEVSSFLVGTGKETKALVKTYEKLIVVEIKEVQENPSTNSAIVTASLKKTNPTPFFSVKNESELTEIELKFHYTSNGWKYCK